jgi:2-dehydropantoate 2-reductase
LYLKILVYGAGVIGSIFAAKLFLSGEDVTVLARGNRLSEIKEKGIILRNPKTRQQEIAYVKAIDTLLPDMQYDYIFVVMQRTQVDSVLNILSQNCSKNIVFVVNTAAGYDEWINQIGAKRLMLVFPSAGGEKIDGVVNYFIGKGLMRFFQTTTVGEVVQENTKRVSNIIRAFNKAGIPTVYCLDMDTWQKTHVAMVTSIANALYGYGCDNRRLSRSYQSVKDMVLAIKEGFAVLRKLGKKPTPQKLCFFNLPTPILTVVFKLFMGTQLAETTMAKHCAVARQEMICLQSEFDYLIKQSGLPTPNIDKIKLNLCKEN